MFQSLVRKSAAFISILSLACTLVPVLPAHAMEEDVLEEASVMVEVSNDDAGYGGECTIPVTPPAGGFSVSATPIHRNWWEWTPRVMLGIAGGDAYKMAISNYSDFRDGYYGSYATGMKWRVSHPEYQGWKTVYVKFFSSCGMASPVVSRTYYYWGW